MIRIIIVLVLALALCLGITGQNIQAANSSQASRYVEINQIISNDYIIAAFDASASDKSQANVVCDGIADNVDIQNALASNRNILLTTGTYNLSGMVKMDSLSNITLRGTGNTVLRCSTECFYLISSNNIMIQAIDISRTDTNVDGCLVYIDGSSGITLQDNIFHDFYKGIFIRSNNVTHVKSSNIKVINNEFYNYHYSCVMIGNGSEYVDVNDNIIHDGSIGLYGGTLYGISTETIGQYDTVSSTSEWINIERNQIYNQSTHNAIDVHGGNHIRIIDNKIENIANIGIFSHFFRNTGYTGVVRNTDWTISGNIIKNVNLGILVSTAETSGTIDNINIGSNTINDFTDTGILVYITGSDSLANNVRIENNIITGHPGNNSSGYGIKCFADNSVNAFINNVTAENNNINAIGDIYNLRTGVYFRNCGNATISNNTIKYPWENSVLVWMGTGTVISGNLLVDSRYGVELISIVDGRILNNRITATIPIGINDASCVNTLVSGNNWQGSMEDMRYANATNPTIINNIDRNGNPYIEINPAPPVINYVKVIPASNMKLTGIESFQAGVENVLEVPSGGKVTFIAQAYDTNNQPIAGLIYNWSVTNNLAGSINSSGLFTASSITGNYTDVIRAETNGGFDGRASVAVIESNFADLGNQTVKVGQLLEFKVSTDSDHNGLIFSASNLPLGASFESSTQMFSWVPASNQNGNYTVIFEVTDGIYIESEQITITVNSENEAPVINTIGNKTVKAGKLLSFNVSASDADGDKLIYSASNIPAGASFNASTRVFSWTPSSKQVGTYNNVCFQVSDGKLITRQYITITVQVANRAPVFNTLSNKTVSTGSLLTFTVTASDADCDNLTYSAVNLPAGAEFDKETGIFSWVPNSSKKGIKTVRFYVTDGIVTISKGINITVKGPNQAPNLNAISDRTVKAGSFLSFTISGSDPDGDKLTYSASNLPPGAIFNSSSRTFTWKPNQAQAGAYNNVTFNVTDGYLTASRSINITVTK